MAFKTDSSETINTDQLVALTVVFKVTTDDTDYWKVCNGKINVY